MYEVYIEKAAEKDLKKIPVADLERIVPHPKGLAADARPIDSHKISGSKHDWRSRVGTYRITYEFDEKEKVASLLRVRHRCEVYR